MIVIRRGKRQHYIKKRDNANNAESQRQNVEEKGNIAVEDSETEKEK
jgi:hypothetical protein